MKKTIFIIIILIGAFFNITAQEYISRDKAIEDIIFFFDKAEQIHPNLYFKISKDTLLKRINVLKNNIDDSISISEFSRKMITLVNCIRDGHTSVAFSKNIYRKYKNEACLLPFRVKINSGEIIIDKTKTEKLLEGDKIMAINDIGVKELLKLKKYPTVDIDLYREKQLEKYFSFYLFAAYDFTDIINLKISRNGKVISQEIKLIKKAIGLKKAKYSYQVINDSTGVLQINSFSCIRKKSYINFLDSIFTQIEMRDIKQLIIDLRNNGGGNTYYVEILLPYINVTKYRFNQKYYIKTSKPEKRYMRKRYIKWYMYPLYPFAYFSKMGRIFFFKKNGTTTELQLKDERLKPIKRTPYKNKAFLLTSNNTYSAAADFAVAFRYAKRGLIVGDTIGQPYSGFIDKIPVILPNSHLFGGVSFKKYEYIGANENNKKKGVSPDIFIDVDRIYDEKELYKTVIDGWVKDPRSMQQKQESFHKYWHSDKWIQQNILKDW